MKKPKRRAVKDIPIKLDAKFWETLRNLVDSIQWGYTSIGKTLYQERDQALTCLIILSGLRISEILGDPKNPKYQYEPLRKKNFSITDMEVILNRVQTEKHGKERNNIVMPLTGELGHFTKLLLNWLDKVPDSESVVFPKARYSVEVNKQFKAYFHWNKPMSRKRYFKILKETLDKFPHWFRAVCETVYGRLVFENDPYKLKDFMGVQTLEATVPYVESQYEKDIPKAYKLSKDSAN